MGQISEYQRQLPESTAVGTPGVDESGSIIAKAAETATDALIVRQRAIDKVQATSAAYSFFSQDELGRAQLKQQFGEQPEAFQAAYAKQSADLQNKIGSQLPSGQQARFNLLASQRAAKILPQNQNWVFQTQNSNALVAVKSMGDNFSLTAQSWANGDEYVKGTGEYEALFASGTQGQGDIAAASMLSKPREVLQKQMQDATRMYIATQLSNDTGNPVQLRNDLQNNEDFRDRVKSVLGAVEFDKYAKASVKQVESLMSEQTYDMVKDYSFGPQADAKTKQLFDSKTPGLSVANAQRDVQVSENALASLELDPNAKDYQGQIAVMKEQIAQNKAMLEIATNRDDIHVKENSDVASGLEEEIMGAALGITSPKDRLAFKAKVTKETVPGTLPEPEVSEVPVGRLWEYIDEARRKAFGSAESTLSPTYSQHLQELYKVKGKILAARAAGSITDKKANYLIRKFASPLASLEQYTRIQGGDSGYVQAYAQFDKQAKVIALNVRPGTSASNIRSRRNYLRSQMMERFAQKMADLQTVAGNTEFTPTPVGVQAIIDEILNGMRIQQDAVNGNLHIIPGLKKGDIVTVHGKPMVVVGINKDTHKPTYETPKDLDKKLGNT